MAADLALFNTALADLRKAQQRLAALGITWKIRL
jgi:hypothetical protein